MWNVAADSPAHNELNFNRWKLVLSTITALAMAILLIRTYRNSKFPYIYTTAAMLFCSAFFNLLATILFNWVEGC